MAFTNQQWTLKIFTQELARSRAGDACVEDKISFVWSLDRLHLDSMLEFLVDLIVMVAEGRVFGSFPFLSTAELKEEVRIHVLCRQSHNKWFSGICLPDGNSACYSHLIRWVRRSLMQLEGNVRSDIVSLSSLDLYGVVIVFGLVPMLYPAKLDRMHWMKCHVDCNDIINTIISACCEACSGETWFCTIVIKRWRYSSC